MIILFRNLFNYRFSTGKCLKGHSFGNLFLAALADVAGSASSAIEEASRVLRIRGSVLPVTLTRTTLMAQLVDGTEIARESNLDQRQRI